MDVCSFNFTLCEVMKAVDSVELEYTKNALLPNPFFHPIPKIGIGNSALTQLPNLCKSQNGVLDQFIYSYRIQVKLTFKTEALST